MSRHGLVDGGADAVPLIPLEADGLDAWLESQSAETRAWVTATGFTAAAGSVCLQAAADGSLARVLVGVPAAFDPFALAGMPRELPAGRYAVDGWDAAHVEAAALGWGLGSYDFDRYRESKGPGAELVLPDGADAARLHALLDGITLTRDLINTPAADMMPADLAATARELAERHDASLTVISGAELLDNGFPVVHAVGRASVHEPALIDLHWGAADAPKLTLVGKGVCFDSGGLDLKPAAGMRLMKKDMGGAAHVLGLASVIMATGLNVRLRVLVPAVENAVSGDAFRPGDILRARNGQTIEIDNTDAEGRLILADALVAASEDDPDLIVDFATLTGAARIALGGELPALFCNDDATADAVLAAADRTGDPLWRMPLHQPYRKLLDTPFADIVNAASKPLGGAITAALFLQDFVDAGAWAHIDVMAYNTSSSPGHPEGGEAMGLRAFFAALEERYG